MQRWIAAVAALVLLAWPLPVQAQGYSQAAAGARAAILIECESGRVLFEKNAHEQLAMASTTKIMSAWLVLEQPNLDEYFEVDPQAIQVEGSSMGLLPGDQVTLRALAWGMLLPSGNDAAGAAAVRVGGSVEGFVALMNERAQQMGLEGTHFVTPSGLDADGHYTTASDLAQIARAAMQNEEFAKMVQAESAKVQYGNPPYDRWLQNHNRLLWQQEGALGIKTGYTQKAGRCLVSAVCQQGVTLLCVTLGCPDDFNVHQALYAQAFGSMQLADGQAALERLSAAVVGSPVGRVPVRAAAALSCGWFGGEEPPLLSVQLAPFYYAPVEAGQLMGWAVWYGPEGEWGRTALFAAAPAPATPPAPGFWQRVLQGWFSQ